MKRQASQKSSPKKPSGKSAPSCQPAPQSQSGAQPQSHSQFGARAERPAAGNVQRLMELVGQLQLAVGDRLPNIRELAAHLDLKPTEARDALLQAQVMGLVKILPRSGAYVQSLTYATLVDAVSRTLGPALLQQDHNLLQLLDARRFIEVELAGRAAKYRRLEELLPVRAALEAMARIPQTRRRRDYVQADIAFHTEVAKLAGNSLLLTFQQATLQLLEPHLVELPWSSSRRQRTDRSHAAIYKALVAGSVRGARTAMHAHLTLAYESLLNQLKIDPDPINED